VLHAIVEGRYEPPSRRRSDLSPSLEAVVVRAMSRSPAARFEDVRALGRALLPFASEANRMTWQAAFDAGAPGARREGTGRFSIATGSATLSGTRGVRGGEAPIVRELERVHTTLSDSAGEIDDEVRLPASSPRPWFAVGAVVLMLGGGGAYFALQSGSAEGTVQAAAPVAPAQETIRVDVTADPPHASFTLDGRAAGNHALAEVVPRDGRTHEIIVTAEGYASSRITFTDAPPPNAIRLERLIELPSGVDAPSAGEPVAVAPMPSANAPDSDAANGRERSSDRRGPPRSSEVGTAAPEVAEHAHTSAVSTPQPPRAVSAPPAVELGANNAAIVD